jgi:methylenetetrahydrofolate dehydrogenase (NADP+)/methenyltetrahydrofolate cyclohydrolase
MAQIIDGKKIADELTEECKRQIDELKAKGTTPKLAIVTYNPESASEVYANLKLKKAQQLGMDCNIIDWSQKSPDECMIAMKELGNDELVDGIIVQLPANGLEHVQKLLDTIPANKDVDGLSDNEHVLTPATPKAILTLLEKADVDLKGKKIAIVGQGKLVGKPLADIMLKLGYDVSSADSRTNDLSAITKPADVVISAVGKPGLVNGAMIKPGAVVIDAGTSEQHGSLVGDVDYDSVDAVASKIAKVPGGVGPVTVICLLQNVIEASKNSQ